MMQNLSCLLKPVSIVTYTHNTQLIIWISSFSLSFALTGREDKVSYISESHPLSFLNDYLDLRMNLCFKVISRFNVWEDRWYSLMINATIVHYLYHLQLTVALAIPLSDWAFAIFVDAIVNALGFAYLIINHPVPYLVRGNCVLQTV